MLAANAKLQPRTGRTSAVDREAYEFAHSVNIECDNRNAQCHPLARVGLMATTKRAMTCSSSRSNASGHPSRSWCGLCWAQDSVLVRGARWADAAVASRFLSVDDIRNGATKMCSFS